MQFKNVLGAAIVTAAAFPAAAQTPQFTRPYWLDKPVIEALGRAEIEVAANRARFTAAYVETDRSAAEAAAKATARAKLAYDAVKAKVGKDARIETNVSVSPIFDTYKDKDGNVQRYDTPDRISSYAARADMSVTVLDPAKAGGARAAALAAQPNETGPIGFYLQQTAEMTSRAFAAAAADANVRAKAAASAAGATLGPLQVLQEGQGPCLGSWFTPQPGMVGLDYAAAPPPPPPAPMAMMAEAMVGGRKVTISAADVERLALPSDPTPMTIAANVCAIYAVR